MRKAKLVQEIMVIDPDTNNEVQVAMYKHENGGMFGMDCSWLDQACDGDSYPVIPDPFYSGEEGSEVMLQD